MTKQLSHVYPRDTTDKLKAFPSSRNICKEHCDYLNPAIFFTRVNNLRLSHLSLLHFCGTVEQQENENRGVN